MKNKRLTMLVLSAAVALSGSLCGIPSKEVTATTLPTPSVGQALEEGNGTIDLAIANDEKIGQMLKKQGQIPQDATIEQTEKLVKEYLNTLKVDNNTQPAELTKAQEAGLKKYKKDSDAKGKDKKSAVSEAASKKNKEEQKTFNVTKDKALVILMEFPDMPHNKMAPKDTEMYYKDFNNQHYSDMIFGKNGYAGPNGEKFISMYQYYDQQSGKSYEIDGKVAGWYKAENNAAYYGADKGSNHNVNIRALVKEALVDASKDTSINLADYDLKDPNDLDKDGDLNEPDGIIDHLMIIHSGMGQEAGGGALGTDSIWSHSSKVYDNQNGAAVPYKIPGTEISAYPYTVMPEDGGAPVFIHEFGHDLGLPDEYDTNYTGSGEPIAYWSIMSAGSWAGKIPGTETVGFSPYAREFFQKKYGGNWINMTTVDLNSLSNKPSVFNLNQASVRSKKNDVVKVTLPKKATVINTPASGTYEYFSTKGDDLNTSMTTSADLTAATSAKLSLKAWYDIEQDYDYAYIKVKAQGDTTWTNLASTITTTTNPNEQNLGNGITGTSNGWIDATFDLSAFAGKKVDIMVNYVTDPGAQGKGLYVDDVTVTTDKGVVLADNADTAQSVFTLSGFQKVDGKVYTDQNYYLEWRSHVGTDAGLKNIKRGNSIMTYDPGLLVWYRDDYYTENWTGPVDKGGHPGQGYLGIVDAEQNPVMTSTGTVASTRYQMHDAAFGLRRTSAMKLDIPSSKLVITDEVTSPHHIFKDSYDYTAPYLPDAGKILPKYGIKVYLTKEAKDLSNATIEIRK